MMFKSGDRQEYDPKKSWLNYFNMEFTSTSKFQKVAPSKKKILHGKTYFYKIIPAQ